MARKDRAKAPQEAAGDESAVDTGAPTLADGHDEIIEEAPGIGRAADMSAPMGDPGDLSAFGRSPRLPDDLGLGDDPALDDLTNPGGDLGSTLLDDLAGDLSDTNDGWSAPVLDDPGGSNAMDGDHQGDGGSQYGPQHGGEDGATEQEPETPYNPSYNYDHFGHPIESSHQDHTEPDPEDDGSGDHPYTGPSPYETPIPPEADDGTGGDPDISDLIGGRGDVDPPPETEEHGGGELIGDRGDIDPAPETEDAGGSGGLDLVAAGMGAIDPLDGESTLLGGDEGNLAEMTAEADLGGDVESDFDDSPADADIGEEA